MPWRTTRKRPSCASAGALKVNPRELDACGEEQRWTEGYSGRDEGSYKGPCDGPMQKRASRTEIGVSASSGDVAPHPADHDEMGEEYGLSVPSHDVPGCRDRR